MDKHITEEISATEEKKIENPVSHASSNKNDLSMRAKQLFSRKFLIVLILIVVVAGLVLYKQIKQSTPQVKTVTINKQVLQKRSKDLGLINNAFTGKAIDVNTGKIIQAARIFSYNDKTVYLQLDFLTAPKGTVIDYIRYKEGRYVDHGEVVLAKPDTKNLLFNWTIAKLLATSRDGKWKVATYTNGVLAKRIRYDITANKLSKVYPEDSIAENDSELSLKTTLASVSNGN